MRIYTSQGLPKSLRVASFDAPSALVGLVAKPGVATLSMRSDGAPALDQSIAPVWSGLHTFTKSRAAVGDWGLLVTSAVPAIGIKQVGAAANNGLWRIAGGGEQFSISALTDAETTAGNFLVVDRTNAKIDALAFGNAADNPVYTFLGTGAVGFGGNVTVTSNLFVGNSIAKPDGTRVIDWTPTTYGTFRVSGSSGGYTGVQLQDSGLNPTFMTNGTACGLFLGGESGGARWMLVREDSVSAACQYRLKATAFDVTSSRALKRETGTPSSPQRILAQLRPILYKLLADGDAAAEQIGLIAEEVHEVCPQLSDGKTVSYDRLALLLLADWQQQRGSARPAGAE